MSLSRRACAKEVCCLYPLNSYKADLLLPSCGRDTRGSELEAGDPLGEAECMNLCRAAEIERKESMDDQARGDDLSLTPVGQFMKKIAVKRGLTLEEAIDKTVAGAAEYGESGDEIRRQIEEAIYRQPF